MTDPSHTHPYISRYKLQLSSSYLCRDGCGGHYHVHVLCRPRQSLKSFLIIKKIMLWVCLYIITCVSNCAVGVPSHNLHDFIQNSYFNKIADILTATCTLAFDMINVCTLDASSDVLYRVHLEFRGDRFIVEVEDGISTVLQNVDTILLTINSIQHYCMCGNTIMSACEL